MAASGAEDQRRAGFKECETIRLERFETVGEYLVRVGTFLSEREAEHNLILGICTHLEVARELFEGPPDLIVAIGGFRVVATAVRTPPFNIVLSEVDDPAALEALAEAFTTGEVAGLTGPADHAATFSELWSERTGRGHRLTMNERIHRLTAVVRPAQVRGVLRAAMRTDRDVLAAWLRAFESEAFGKEVPADAPSTVDRWLSGRGRTMYVWDDGGPVSMCGVGGTTPHGSRIGPVYTPRELRNQGYVTAAVAGVSQAQLDTGRRYCFLFTDLANPTSNHIYASVGYEPVRDISMYSFERG